jgi:uncharacterized membrane protein YtjA (UPF0391 family)
MGIWGCEGWFDRELSRRMSGCARGRRLDFVPGHRGILMDFCRGNCPELLFRLPIISAIRAMFSVALMSKTESEAEDRVMFGWVVTFLIVALIAGILGFGGVAGASIEIAKIIFFVAVVLFLISAVVSLARGRTQI